MGRVGSSTDLIAQRVEFVHESDKRSHLLDLLHAQRANGVQGKVCLIFLHHWEDAWRSCFFVLVFRQLYSLQIYLSLTCASIKLIFLGKDIELNMLYLDSYIIPEFAAISYFGFCGDKEGS